MNRVKTTRPAPVDFEVEDGAVSIDYEDGSVEVIDTNLIDVARSLASDDGENHEYDRALVELVAGALGLGSLYSDRPDTTTTKVLGS